MKRFYWVNFIVALLFISCHENNKQTGKAYYEGEDISSVANILRDKNTKAATLIINTGGKWVLYAGFSTDGIDYSEPVAGGFIAGRYPLAVSDSARVYFQLITDKGRSVLSEKRLPMAGGYNFRDLGGVCNKDGKYIKWGKLFRSDDMFHLTGEDLSYLASIPVTSVVDFREDDEVQKAPDKYPVSVVNVHHLPVMPDSLSMEVVSTYSVEKLDTVMMNMYVKLVSDSASVRQYRKFFGFLQDKKNMPLLFHCSAGKDRTGMATALIMYALNVDEEIIMQDYLSSNIYLGGKYDSLLAEQPYLKPLFEVKPEFLTSGIEQMRKSRGTVENYLKTVLGVDIDLLKRIYLE